LLILSKMKFSAYELSQIVILGRAERDPGIQLSACSESDVLNAVEICYLDSPIALSLVGE